MSDQHGDIVTSSDLELVERAQAGDRSALDELLDRHYDRIAARCRRIAGNTADGDDATQEALLAIVRGLTRFDGRSSFSTWAYRVATNACLDELRRRGRRPTPTEDDLDRVERDHGDDLADDVARRDEVRTALATLTPEFRAPLVLRDLEGLDYAEIAETLDLPPGTVRSRIARARRQLADRLGNQEAGS